jgi:hypothetical protein
MALSRAATWTMDHVLQGGPFEVASGETTVVVVGLNDLPTEGRLALDVVLGRLALRVERIEILIEAFAGGLARVDGAADARPRGAVAVLVVFVTHTDSLASNPKKP